MHRNNRGMTLVEVIIVISIMGILALILTVNYRAYNKRNQLRESAQLVRSAIVEAQNTALAPKNTDIISSDWRYGAKWKDARTFVVYQTNPSIDTDEKVLRSYTLPSPIEWGTSNWDVQFMPPNASAILPCINTLPIQLKLTGTSESTTVTLNCVSGQTNITP